MAIEVKVPGVGESVQEGMIESWHKSTGDWVNTDDVLCELETDKATVEVTAETEGIIEIIVEAGSIVKVGDVIARIEQNAQKPPQDTKAKPSSADSPKSLPTASTPQLDPGPAVRRIAQETGIDPATVAGTGRGGRPTKGDMLAKISQQEVQTTPSASLQDKSNQKSSSQANEMIHKKSTSQREETRKPMSMLRRRIAERLIHSQQTAAILTTFNEVDMTKVMELRSTYKDAFEKKYTVKLGFMGFFLKASVAALESFPSVNAYIDGTDICYHNYCDIGVAVSTEKGLMVPIIKNVQELSIAEIELEIALFAKKARDNKISLEDLSGGTFTVSNGGVFGSLLSTPIINPPQTAILGMHKTEMRPRVMPDGSIAARPMMYLALSYDHRLIDGKEAVGFLVKIKECIEDPTRLLLGV